MKTKPTRKCLATNTIHPKNELFRIVKTPSGEVVLDITGKLNGRGAYIAMNNEAIEIARKSKCLDRSLETTVPDSVYERMISYLKMK